MGYFLIYCFWLMYENQQVPNFVQKKHTIMKTILALTIILFVFVFSSCKGPQGDPGPQGATGAAGAAGAQGPAGQNGAPGKVTFYATEWIKSDGKFWIEGYDAATLTSSMSLLDGAISKLTQADLNGGIILVYDTYEEDKSVINALPYDFVFGDNHVWFSYGASRLNNQNTINLYATFTKNVDPKKFFTETMGKDSWYRVIIIPALAGARLKNLDFKDYNAVKKHLGLKD